MEGQLTPRPAETQAEKDFRRTLHETLEEICQSVSGFELLATKSSEGNKISEDDICLQTVKRAIDLGLFSNFDEFEYAVFRLMQQAKSDHLNIL